jgi:hypothetical protein
MAVSAAGRAEAPQDSQNFTPGSSGAPHFAQAGNASILAPQDSQNFIPGKTGLPHFWQVLGFSVIIYAPHQSGVSVILNSS